MGVKVLGHFASMFAMRVIIALKEKGVEYEYEEDELIPKKGELLLKCNPVYKKVPVLLHDGKPLCESLIIVQYVDEVWEGKRPLLSPNPYDRAQERFWADVVDKKFYDPMFRMLRSADVEIREQAKRDFAEALATMDWGLREVFGGGRPFFGGDCIGFVDVALAPFLCWFPALEALGGFKVPDENQCPHLHAWMKHIREHPSVKETFENCPPYKLVPFLRKVYVPES